MEREERPSRLEEEPLRTGIGNLSYYKGRADGAQRKPPINSLQEGFEASMYRLGYEVGKEFNC